MKSILKRFGWLILVVLAALALWAYARTRAVAVETAQVSRGAIEQYVTEEAQTQLDAERILVADRAGTLRRITLEEGDPVRAGQELAAIEDTELELELGMLRDQLEEIQGRLDGVDVPLPKPSEIQTASEQIRQAQAEVERLEKEEEAAKADLAYAQREFERTTELHQKGTASEQQLDTARRNLEVARAGDEALARQLEAARIAVDVARLRRRTLDESMQDTAHLRVVYSAQRERVRKSIELLKHEAAIRSPLDGVVLEKYVDSQRFVQPGTQLLKVGDPDTIEIRSDILSEEVGLIEVGQKAILVGRAIRAGDAAGRVKKVYPSGFTKISSLGVQEQRVPVLIEFDNSRLGLQAGYELDVKIVVAAAENALLVPAEAVFATAEGSAVFVVEGGRARRTEIETGLTGEDHYEVVEGLSEGQTVVLRPPTELEDGARVEATPKE